MLAMIKGVGRNSLRGVLEGNTEYAREGVRFFTACDHACSVEKVAATPEMGGLGQLIGFARLVIGLTELAEKANSTFGLSIDWDRLTPLEGFETYMGSFWILCTSGRGEASLIYEGKRGAFLQHTAGWNVSLEGATEVVIATTLPETIPCLIEGVPHRAVSLPRPEGWLPPGADRG